MGGCLLGIPIVFFEVSTLIAASVREVTEDLTIEHKFYSESKGLVNLISKRCCRGITTFTVEEQANSKLEKAIQDELREKEAEIRRDKEKYRAYTILYDSIQRKFLENLRKMDRLSVDEEKTKEILTKEVVPMYYEIFKEETEPPEAVWSLSARFKRVAIEITNMQRRRHYRKLDKLKEKSIIPDYTDMLILSEAAYLKRTRFKNQKMFLASLDNHFSGISSPYQKIPIEIERRFKIKCLTPIKLITYLRR